MSEEILWIRWIGDNPTGAGGEIGLPVSLLRDLFAGMMVAAIHPDWEASPEAFAARGYELADALMQERERRGT